MTVGKDAVERTVHPPNRRKVASPRSHIFLLGVGAGGAAALLLGVFALFWRAGDEPTSRSVRPAVLKTSSVGGGATESSVPPPSVSGESSVPPPPASDEAAGNDNDPDESSEPTRDVAPALEAVVSSSTIAPEEGGSAETRVVVAPLQHWLKSGETGPPAPDIVVVEGEIQPNQFLATMLISAGLTNPEADRTVRALSKHFDPTKSRPGDRYRVDIINAGELGRFEYQPAPDQIYQVNRDMGEELVSRRLTLDLKRQVVTVEGQIEHSLWVAFEESGESPALAADLTEAFRFDIDFFHDTRRGDKFRFFVEKYSHQGELVRYGQIYAAEYIGANGSPVGTKRLYWYENRKSKTKGFYDETGKAAQRAFLRSPLKYTRISSDYGFRRHPILGRRHFHGGIDYAAPTGTPVRAVASGTVVAAGMAGPNGKMVRIRHSGGYESFYLHLSRIMVRKSARVSQSTIIGKVGSTGRSTGPHLDFRLKKNGKYLNPRKNVAPRTKRIQSREQKMFKKQIAPWLQRMTQSPSGGTSELATSASRE